MAQFNRGGPTESFRRVLNLRLEEVKKKIMGELIEEFTQEMIKAASGLAIDLEEYYSTTGDGHIINISLRFPAVTLPLKDKEESQESTEK